MADAKFSFQEKGKMYHPAWIAPEVNHLLHHAWDEEEVARVGEGEEGGLVGSAELGDPNLAGGPVLPMKLRVCRLGICLLVSLQLLL